jgi:hypothetical protein
MRTSSGIPRPCPSAPELRAAEAAVPQDPNSVFALFSTETCDGMGGVEGEGLGGEEGAG